MTGCRVSFVHSVKLSSERGGILAEIVATGTDVPAGGSVGRLRDAVLRANLAIVEREAANDIEVRFAAKATELSQLKYERALAANGQSTGTVSELELKELRLAWERAGLQAEQADHRLTVSRLRRDEILAAIASLGITAPFDARVRAVFKQPGEVVQEGEIVAELVNTQRIRVEGNINLRDLAQVSLGTEVHVRIEGKTESTATTEVYFRGLIAFIDVNVEPVSQKVRIAAELDNREGLLREGLTATMFVLKTRAAIAGHAPATATDVN